VQYTDLSQFGNLAITNIEPPQTNRLTLGVWVNVASISKMSSSTNNIINISVSQYLVMTLHSSSSSNIDVYCTVNFKIYNTLDTATTLSSLNNLISTNNIQTSKSTASNVSNRWFYARCAMSFDHALTYSMNKIDDNAPTVVSNSLNKENLYSGLTNDIYFRTYYRVGDTLTLKVNNANLVGSSVFLKNLYLFREFIPSSNYFHY
jgi:hypothetical protein